MKKEPESWEIKFEQECPNGEWGFVDEAPCLFTDETKRYIKRYFELRHQEQKDFIRQELSRAEQAGRDKLLKELDITKDFKGAEIKRIKEQAKQERTREIIAMMENKKDRMEHFMKGKIATEYWITVLQSYLESNTKE